jgi:serine/threonine-protein kinase RsbW
VTERLFLELSALGPRQRAGGLDAELRLRIPSDVAIVEEAVDLVSRHLEASFADLRTIRFNLRVALAEAVVNAILYGNSEDRAKAVAIRALFGRHAVEVEVTDEGGGFDYRHVPDPTLPANLLRPYGRGLFIIRQLVDEVRFNDAGNSICLILRRA